MFIDPGLMTSSKMGFVRNRKFSYPSELMRQLNESDPTDKLLIQAARWERRPHMRGDQVTNKIKDTFDFFKETIQ